MATLTADIADATKQIVDEQIASGRFQNASDLFETAVNGLMWLEEQTSRETFTDAERKRIDQMLREADASLARGDYVPIRPGEFEELAQRLVDQNQT